MRVSKLAINARAAAALLLACTVCPAVSAVEEATRVQQFSTPVS